MICFLSESAAEASGGRVRGKRRGHDLKNNDTVFIRGLFMEFLPFEME